MVEITASDIYWIGAMDKISLGLIFLACLSALLIICAIQIYSGAMALFGALLGIACTTAFIFIPSSQTMAAMKVLPAIVNNQRIQGISESTVKLTEQFLKENLETLKSKDKSWEIKNENQQCGIPECFHPRHRIQTCCGSYRAEVDSPL